VPWPAVGAAVVVVVASIGLAVWLRRRGLDEGLSTT
jgi:hypothetical protein